MTSETLSVSALVQQRFPQWVLATHAYRGQDTVIVNRDGLLDGCRWLRDEPATAFDVLMDLSCVDYLTFGKRLESAPRLSTPSPLPYFMQPKPSSEKWERLPAQNATGSVRPGGSDYRFEVVYHFYSLAENHRLRLKVPVSAEDPVVPSLTGLWKSADWFEREVWDMFGIRFTGHPNLTRILMYEPFEGHPLRKDYPVNKRQPLIGPVN